jgi:hypothetical protein
LPSPSDSGGGWTTCVTLVFSSKSLTDAVLGSLPHSSISDQESLRLDSAKASTLVMHRQLNKIARWPVAIKLPWNQGLLRAPFAKRLFPTFVSLVHVPALVTPMLILGKGAFASGLQYA